MTAPSEQPVTTPEYVENYSFVGAELYAENGLLREDPGAHTDSWQQLILPFVGEEMRIPLTVINRSFEDFAEMKPAIPVGCILEKTSLDADGEVTEDGILTVRKPGVYFINTLAQYGDQVGGPIRTAVIVTEKFDSYEQCRCVVDWELTKPVFTGEIRHLKNGAPIRLELRENVIFDSRLCDAAVHKEVFELPGFIDRAPEGADCGIKDDIYFYTNTPGEYLLSGRQVVAGRYNIWDSGLIVLKKE